MTNIYIAYRTGYKANYRQMASFQAESILDWFQQHWQTLQSDKYKDLLGFDIYGLPLYQVKENEEIAKPQNMDELSDSIQRLVYCNELHADEHCLQVLTDDDEIELAWYVFDETYKQQNMDKLAVWFTKGDLPSLGELSVASTQSKQIDIADLPRLSLANDADKATYLVASPIYDGANLEDTCAVKLEGVRLPELIAKLVEIEEFEDDEIYTATSTLEYLQTIAKAINSNDITKIIAVFNQYPATEVDEISIETFEELKEQSLGNEPEKSLLNINEHLIELGINSMGAYYNYYVMFDDLWVADNEQLATSLLHFGKGWQV